MVNIEIVDFETVIEVSNFEKSIKYYTEVLDFNLDWIRAAERAERAITRRKVIVPLK